MNYNENTLIWLLLIANLFFAVNYMIIRYEQTKMRYVFLRGIIMICCPVTAVCCYFLSYLFGVAFRQEEVDYENLSMDKTKKEFEQEIDKDAEMKMLPMEEVLTVSTTKDRREAMINLLRSDISENLGLIRKAVENEDPETAHYAASALTDIMGKFTGEINRLQAVYDADRSNPEVNEEYIDTVLRILDSGALIGVEEMMYLYIYTGLVENLMHHHPDSITSEQCSMMVRALFKEGKGEQAESWAELSLNKWPDEEQSYFNLLYIKYNLEKKEDFYKVLDELKGSGIPLSPKGLDIIRYWLSR